MRADETRSAGDQHFFPTEMIELFPGRGHRRNHRASRSGCKGFYFATPKPLVEYPAMLGSRRAEWITHLNPATVGLFAAGMALVNAFIARRWGGDLHFAGSLDVPSDRELAQLRNSLLGSGKRKVGSILGPPCVTKTGPDNTWYYPPSRKEHLAIAISFDRDIARQVEFVKSPARYRR
jgi:hypothetical protein